MSTLEEIRKPEQIILLANWPVNIAAECTNSEKYAGNSL
jgi:hypothetical protein